MLGRVGVLCSGALVIGGAVAITGPAEAGAGETVVAFEYRGASVAWQVPENVCQVTVSAYGAQGGNGQPFGSAVADPGEGGLGGQADASVEVAPFEILTVTVGGRGTDAVDDNGTSSPGTGGFNGGGDGGFSEQNTGSGGGGGGMTDLRRGTALLVVAGGGGGGGGSNETLQANAGGDGGAGGGNGTDGGPGSSSRNDPAGGGMAGGSGGGGGTGVGGADAGEDGAPGAGGSGGDSAFEGGGGGGGGHPIGGGGGGGTQGLFSVGGGGGGGGSGFTPDGSVMSDGVRAGDGYLEIRYTPDAGCGATASAAVTGRCPPDAEVTIEITNPHPAAIEVRQDGQALGSVDPGATRTFTAANTSADITATADGHPVNVDVVVATPSCVDDEAVVRGRPTLSG